MRTLRMMATGVVAATALLGTALSSSGVSADQFKGKTVTVIVPSGSGGIFHLYGQLVQRHIGKHLPGNPTVFVQNRPGAGGVKAANYMAKAAPNDGTVIAEINPGTVIISLMRNVRFEPRNFNWLESVSVRTYTLGVWHDVAADTLDKQKSAEVIMGASGVGSLNFQLPTFLNAVIGTNTKSSKDIKAATRSILQWNAAKRKVPLNTRSWQTITSIVNEAFTIDKKVPQKLASILGFQKKK